MKKFLSLALALALSLSLTVPAFAANQPGKTTIPKEMSIPSQNRLFAPFPEKILKNSHSQKITA